MSIPFNDNLRWNIYHSIPDWHKDQPTSVQEPLSDRETELRRAIHEAFVQTFKQIVIRSVQCIRDVARLVLKVPLRSIWTPIVLPENWMQLERAKINAKLAGYSFIQLVSIPVKFMVALAAIATAAISWKKSQRLLNKSENWTIHLDGRASQLEALKEVGGANAKNRDEYDLYKVWLYSIDSKLCRKTEAGN